MSRLAVLVISGMFVIGAAGEASAHFLFLRLGDHAEAGRAVEVFFSDHADAGDPKFVEKIAGTQLWVQGEPGKFEPLEVRRLNDRLRAAVPGSGSVSVTGRCDYGVLTRKVAFLLKYYPKGIAGDPAKLAALAPNKELPLEIMGIPKDGTMTFQVLQNGKPVPKIKLTTVDDSLTNEEFETDAQGNATWKPPSNGHYCVYASVTTPRAGEWKGTAYSEVREFATLCFRWPLVRTDADEEAVELFEKAIAARASWAKFPGFSADVKGSFDGANFAGKVRVAADGKVTLEGIDNAAAAKWLDDQIGSIVLHRKASPDRERPVLRFADDDTQHPLGRLVTFSGGQFASSYRVKDDQLLVVNRNLGRQNMTITIIENSRNAEGKVLPHSYTVHYWDAATGRLNRVETVQNRWTRTGGLDLPALLSVTTASESGLSVRTLHLSGHIPGETK